MAAKQFMTLDNLSTYDQLLKSYIGTEDAKSIKSITVVGNTVNFYKNASASGDPSYTVTLPDVSGFMDKIASATGGMVVVSDSNGGVAESDIAIDSVATGYFDDAVVGAIVTYCDGTNNADITAGAVTLADLASMDYVGEIPAGATSTTIVDYIDEVADTKIDEVVGGEYGPGSTVTDAINAVSDEVDDVWDALGDTYSSGNTVAGAISDIWDALGDTYSSSNTVASAISDVSDAVSDLDGSLAAIAKSGDSADATYDNTNSGLTATNVQSAIDEVVAGLGTAAAADVATSAIQEESTDDSLVSAAQVASFVAAEIAGLEGAMHFRGVVTRQSGETDAQAIARVIPSPEAGDVVVMSDNAKEYIYNGTAWEEVGDEAEFVKRTTTIAGVDLQDNITKTELLNALNVADGAQVNVVESVKVNGSALTPDGNKAVNVTVAEGATNGTVAVNGTDVAVHGLGSAAYTASTAYEAAGAVATAIAALDADLDASGTAQHSGTFVVSGVTEVDGVLTAVDSVEVEAAGAAATAKSEVIGASTDAASANTIYGAKAYADAATEEIPTASIQALFA